MKKGKILSLCLAAAVAMGLFALPMGASAEGDTNVGWTADPSSE